MPDPIPLEEIKIPRVRQIERKVTNEGIFSSYKFTTTSTHTPIPRQVKTSYFDLILPHQYEKKQTPVILHFPAMGDSSFFLRKQFIARPLLKQGIGSLILQSPFYGT